ncbi:MAG TPA: xanthine dehydrogenase family protein molybdopterin-binding subunit [bacterium]|nr:xanthine dehydrogenase family protein molybdopterin-binding subunit [bacterium]
MVRRVDAKEKVTGRAIYADDLCFDRMIHAAPLHSAWPSAKIVGISTERALAHPGVVDVITAADIPGKKQVGGIIADQFIIADDRVRYSGDVVAVVAAETPAAAREAAGLIEVEYEPESPILSPEEALKPGAPRMHPGRNNVVTTFRVRHGDVKRGFCASDIEAEAEFNTQFIEHAYMEPESCVAVPEPDGSVTVYGGMQHPFSSRRFVAAATGLPLAMARVVQTTLGGGFGGRDDTIAAICARAAVLALRTNRPVKMTYTREESVRESYKRHPFHLRYRAGIGRDGKFRAMEVDITADSGPYCSVSPFVIWRPTVQCTGPYAVPNVHCDTRAVYTNNTFTGAMRGFGSPQHVFACEQFIDICAEKAGLDPLEFRKLNFFRQGTITHTGQKLSGHKVSLEEVTDRALKAIGWKKKYPLSSRGKPGDDGLLRGVGFACSYRGCSLGAEGNDFCSAIVNVQPDGSVLLEVGVSENGQGLKTAMVHILAVELGIREERIRFVDTDTSSIPDGGPTVASRGTIVGGGAVVDAAKKIRDLMAPVLKDLIGASKKGYAYRRGRIANPSNGKSVSFEKAVASCHARRMYLHALGAWQGPRVSWDEKTGQGNAYFTYVYGCQACELTVDPRSGRVKVIRVAAAHEVGKAINPQMALGQVFGGIMMGLGFALTEEIKHEDGVIQNLNFNTYRIPRSTDAPEMTAILVENPDSCGPWGAKSLGEPTNEIMGGAVANAIAAATGRRIFRLPITAERIKAALGVPEPEVKR